MAGDEDEAQQIVADVVVDRVVEIAHDGLPLCVDLSTELFALPLEPLLPTEAIDRTVLRDRHEPRARVVGNAGLGPRLERGDERVLRELFGETDVTHHAREPGDEPRRFDPPNRV